MMKSLLIDVFCQADMVKGWRYLDDAGKIMNRWDSAFPDKTVGVDGLTMRNKDEVFETLKVNPLVIWLHFSVPEKLEYVVDVSRSTIEGVSEILGVSQYRRIGLRLQYFHGIERARLGAAVEQVGRNLFASRWGGDGATSGISPFNFQFIMRVAEEPVEVKLRVGTGRMRPESRGATGMPEEGILVDVDLSRQGVLDIADLGGSMKRATDWVAAGLPDVESRVLGGVDDD